MMVGIKDGIIRDIRRILSGEFDLVGEATGSFKLDNRVCGELKRILEEYLESGEHDLGYEDLFPSLFAKIPFGAISVDGLKWREIDFEDDVCKAESLAKGNTVI